MYFCCCRVTQKCFCLASGYYSPTSRDRRRNYPRDAHREESEPAICRPPNLSLFFPRRIKENQQQQTTKDAVFFVFISRWMSSDTQHTAFGLLCEK
jgi:hypothetical protein